MKHFLRLLKLCLTALLLLGLFMTARQLRGEQISARDVAEAAQLAGLSKGEPAASSSPSQPDGTAEESLGPPFLADLDLEALRAVNSDVAGWIEIPGTAISYPLMQGTDNQYYLKHTWKKEASANGSIFLDCAASRSLTDFHSILYGHRMRNGSMFAALQAYEDAGYWQEHPSVYVAAGTGVCRYDIFAAYEADVDSIIYRWEDGGAKADLIQYGLDRSVIHTGITPGSDAHILTLSTCTSSVGGNYAKRWVVQTVLSEKWEAPE